SSGSAPARLAGLGETAVGIAFDGDSLAAKDQGYPITLTYPSEGTGYEVGSVALIKNGPKDQEENAKKFIDWIVSKEGQDSIVDNGWFFPPLHPDAKTPEGLPNNIKVIDYDAEWSGAQREALVQKFSDKIVGEE